MSAVRFLGLVALVYGTGACARHHVGSPVPTEAAPKASVYATTSGGLLDRTAEASFRVDESAYVMVGHLGGDGRIEIVYPEHGLKTGYVSAKTWYRSETFEAYYDAIPAIYSLGTTRYRSLVAQAASYDGRGHGFIFLIAARRPLHFDRISEFGLWSDLNVDAYESSLNPQESIRSLADYIAGDQQYTLRFATSYSTISLASLASQQMDCAYLASFNLAALLAPYGYGYLGSTLFDRSGMGFLSNCGNMYRYAWNDPYSLYNNRYGGFRPYPFGPPISPRTPDSTAAPGGPRGHIPSPQLPGKRVAGQPGPAFGLNRPTVGRPSTGLTPDDVAHRDIGSSFRPRNGDSQVSGRSRAGVSPDGPSRYSPRSPFEDPPSRSLPRSNPAGDSPRAAPQREAPHSNPAHESPRMPAPREIERPQPTREVSRPAPAPSPQPTQESKKPEVREP